MNGRAAAQIETDRFCAAAFLEESCAEVRKIKGRLKYLNKIAYVILLSLLFLSADAGLVLAEDGGGTPDSGRLIQTTTEKEEKQALLNLRLLDAEAGNEENLQKAERENMHCVTRISMGAFYGSGVILDIDEDGVVLVTNKHVLQYGETGRVTFPDGFEAEGRTWGVSSGYDVGFMRVAWEELPVEEFKKLKRVSISRKCMQELAYGDEIFLIGSADGAAGSVYEGTLIDAWWYIEDFGTYMIYSDCYGKPGMSGGGTFDAHGHYIGMLTGGNGEDTASLPLTVILEEYEKLSGKRL